MIQHEITEILVELAHCYTVLIAHDAILSSNSTREVLWILAIGILVGPLLRQTLLTAAFQRKVKMAVDHELFARRFWQKNGKC